MWLVELYGRALRATLLPKYTHTCNALSTLVHELVFPIMERHLTQHQNSCLQDLVETSITGI